MTDFMNVNDDPNLDIDSSRRSLLNNNDNLDCLPNLLAESGGEDIPTNDDRHFGIKQPARRKSLRKSQRIKNHQREYLKLFIPGVVAIILGVLIYAIDPFNFILDFAFSLRDGSLIYNFWRAPPLKALIKVYVFNVTNGQRFVDGLDPKLKLKEIGPYVYSDQITHNDVKFYKNNSLSFIGRHSLQYEPEFSIADPSKERITVTNAALLALASKVFNAPTPVVLGISSAISYVNPPTILNMTVHELLWGYEEPLVTLAHKFFPTWINFEKVGILDRMLDEGDNRLTISGGTENRFRIEKLNGLQGLTDWGYRPDVDRGNCDLVNGTYDGMVFSPNPPDRMRVYRKLFCRPFPIRALSGKLARSKSGVRVKEYMIAEDALDNDNPDNKCYCYQKGGCFPSGIGDISPCYFGIPVGMSLPHFLGADEAVYSKLDGIKPDKKKHTSYFQIQPDIGIPLYGRIPVQLNIIVRRTRFIGRVKPFNDMVIPLFWVEVVLEGLPSYIDTLIWLLLEVLPTAQLVLIISCITGGLLLVFAANIRYAWNSKPWERGLYTRKRASIISYKIKQETRRLSTRSQHFIPLSTMDAPRARS